MAYNFGIYFKPGVNANDLKYLTKNCQELFFAAMRYMQDRQLPFEITSLQSDRDGVVAVSKTHEQGRAFDVSSKYMDEESIRECVAYFNKYYQNIAAISSKDLKARACVYHDAGYGSHFHFQVRPQGT